MERRGVDIINLSFRFDRKDELVDCASSSSLIPMISFLFVQARSSARDKESRFFPWPWGTEEIAYTDAKGCLEIENEGKQE